MQAHPFGVAEGQNEPGALAVVGADLAENIGRGGALIVRGRWPRSPLRPPARDLVLLTDAGLVGVQTRPAEIVQAGGKALAFLS